MKKRKSLTKGTTNHKGYIRKEKCYITLTHGTWDVITGLEDKTFERGASCYDPTHVAVRITGSNSVIYEGGQGDKKDRRLNTDRRANRIKSDEGRCRS